MGVNFVHCSAAVFAWLGIFQLSSQLKGKLVAERRIKGEQRQLGADTLQPLESLNRLVDRTAHVTTNFAREPATNLTRLARFLRGKLPKSSSFFSRVGGAASAMCRLNERKLSL